MADSLRTAALMQSRHSADAKQAQSRYSADAEQAQSRHSADAEQTLEHIQRKYRSDRADAAQMQKYADTAQI